MNINPINNQNFQAKIRIYPSESKFNMNLQEFVNKNGYIIEEYADRHGIKDIALTLKKGMNNIKTNADGDFLMINCGAKTSAMPFDNTTTELATRKTILQNIQTNYNLLHPKKA